MKNMKELYLPLIAQWYEMIESLIKPEEYRDISSYWIQRLMVLEDGTKIPKFLAELYSKHIETLKVLLSEGKVKFRKFKFVRFSYGYTKRTMTFELSGITIGKGREEWGAPSKDVFVIKLGERVKQCLI